MKQQDNFSIFMYKKYIWSDLILVMSVNYWFNDFCLIVLLEAPDTVLIERVMGKRIDPETGGKYLQLFQIYCLQTISLS